MTCYLSRFRCLTILMAVCLFTFTIKTPAPLPPSIIIQNFSGTPVTSLTFSNLSVGETYRLQHKTGWYWTDAGNNFTATDTQFSQTVTGAVRNVDYRFALNPVPNQAFATALVTNGRMTAVTITSTGSGYSSTPSVNVVRGGGTNASVVAGISETGNVTNLVILDSGSNYLHAPTIQIAPPPANVIFPEAQQLIRFKFSDNAIGWRLLATTNISGSWWIVTNLTSSQIDLSPQGDSVFFRMSLSP